MNEKTLYQRVKRYKALLIAVPLSFTYMQAQLSPANDPNWVLQPSLSHEFNGPLPLTVDNIGLWSSNPNSDLFFPNGWGADGEPYNAYPINPSLAPPNYIIDNQSTSPPYSGNGNLRMFITGNSATTAYPPTPLPSPYTDVTNWWWSVPGGRSACDWRCAGIYSNPWHQPGPLHSTPVQYKYGYFEIFAKLPGYISNPNHTPTGTYPGSDPNSPAAYDYSSSYPGKLTRRGVAGLWYFSGGSDNTCPNSCYSDEVDIFEGHDTFDPYAPANAIPVHWFSSHCDDNGVCREDRHGNSEFTFYPKNGEVDADLVNQFHKYGFEWMPDRMIFYFDDVPFYTNYNVAGIPQHPMAMFLSAAVTQPGNGTGPNGLMEFDAPIPSSYNANNTMQFVIDYFRYYQINTTYCQVDYAINTNTDLANFPPMVRQNVDVTANVLMNVNSTKLVRHSGDFTTLAGVDFEVPLGSELTIMPTPCQ